MGSFFSSSDPANRVVVQIGRTTIKEESVQMSNMNRLLVFLIALGAISAKAQVPSGTFTYVFTHEPLWDVTGTYTLNGSSNGVTDNAIFVITNSAKGAITGTQTETLNDGSITINVHSRSEERR